MTHKCTAICICGILNITNASKTLKQFYVNYLLIKITMWKNNNNIIKMKTNIHVHISGNVEYCLTLHPSNQPTTKHLIFISFKWYIVYPEILNRNDKKSFSCDAWKLQLSQNLIFYVIKRDCYIVVQTPPIVGFFHNKSYKSASLIFLMIGSSWRCISRFSLFYSMQKL